MNKYVLRTSLFWLCVLGLAVGFLLYRPNWEKKEIVDSGTQAVAAGPAPTAGNLPPSSAQSMEAPLAPVQLTPDAASRIGLTTVIAERKPLSGTIRATGTVAINERLVSFVQVRFRGYVRKVFANATYQYVHKGEPLFSIYSPDLAATEQDYLNALENEKTLGTSTVEGVASAAKDVTAATEARLRQWEVAPNEIIKLKQTGTAIPELIIDSPVSGYITGRNAFPNSYVESGTRLYTVADLSRVWIDAQVFQDDIGKLRPGDVARMKVDAYAGRAYSARIESILPQVDMATRTVRVRLGVANPGVTLKPGMFVNVELETNLGVQLVIPASTVLQSGSRQLVFVDQGDGRLEPKEVLVGSRAGDDFVVLKGLQAGQRVVTSANFLLDSESQLQAAARSYTPPPPGAGNPATPSSPARSGQVKVDFTTDPSTPHKGSNVFRVKLLGADGIAVDGADLTVTFFMPAMPAMGMAAMKTTVRLTAKGSGIYEGSGELGSGGSWQVTITARKAGNEIATKQLRLNAEGGM
jgi:RND family efflux transporter MFP subunit